MKPPIRPSSVNPRYWEYAGQPVMLLGGTVEDNVFQIPDLPEHLRLLAGVGGNYIRCTLSSRDEGNVWPFERDGETGLYDLDRIGKEFFRRFASCLALASELDIIVQIEVWATFDFYREPWQDNPFNPRNNKNYSAEESGLPVDVTTHPTRHENPFFYSVPGELDNAMLRAHQERFVDAMLAISLRYPNVLYCMDNETSVTPRWADYWARYIRKAAEAAGVPVQLTEMWDAHDLDHPQHRNTFDHPELFSFVDVSQNNHQDGDVQWTNGQAVRARLDPQRPMNNVKIYGADGGRHGPTARGVTNFWRNVVGGMASARFHRPPSGLGLSPLAQQHIRAARAVADAYDLFAGEPRMDLLVQREANNAYCNANPPDEAIVLFTGPGKAVLAANVFGPKIELRWLDLSNGTWRAPERHERVATLGLATDGPEITVAHVRTVP